jgi:DNA-binding transcriptional regulator YiaG
MTISGEQIKAARDLLGWSRIKLAIESDVGSGVITSFETGPRVPQGASVDRLV